MKGRIIRIAVYLCVGAALITASFAARNDSERSAADQAREFGVLNAAAKLAYDTHEIKTDAIVSNGSTWTEMLQEMELDRPTIGGVTLAAQQVFNLRRILRGNKLTITRYRRGDFRSVAYRIDPEHQLLVAKDGDDYHAEVHETLGTVTTVPVAGVVEGSLFDSVIAAGEKPELAVRLADIFAWDIDFNTETQPGDTFRLAVEKKEYSDGSPATYGRILAAEYNNTGHPYRAVLFHDPSGRPAYYSADGKSLQKAFLRSPLPFAARISSHFSTHRFHPILKISRPHLGTDYAAPTGTPVQTIADGRVDFAAYKGGDGNMVKISHSRGYETYYMHLSRILVRRGQSVHQGQRIGLVGMTGLATGPHLDFRIQQHGQFVNFERLRLPPANPVMKADMAEFEALRDKWMAMLPGTANTAAQKAQTQSGRGPS